MELAASDCVESQDDWLFGNTPGQADISVAVAWRFIQHIERVNLQPEDYPALVAFSSRAEVLPEFKACPLSD